MDSNQRKTIAVVLTFTFLLGLGSGYLLRGTVKSDSHSMISAVTADQDPAPEQLRDARDRRARPDSPDQSTRDGRGQDRFGQTRPGTGFGYGSEGSYGLSEDRPGPGRMRVRLMRDLNLSEEEAGQFMELLSRHREEGQKVFGDSRRRLQSELQVLREALERDVAAFLDEERLQLWRERYAPRQQGTPSENRTER